MSDKEIIIDGMTVGWGTSAKASPETSTSTTQTFDGAITQGMDKISWTVELEKVRFDKQQSYVELCEKLEAMFRTPAMVTIRETVKTSDETYQIIDNFNGCVLDGWDYEIKPEDMTTESIKFKAAGRERKYQKLRQ